MAMPSLWRLLMCVIVAIGLTFGFYVLISWLIFITHKIQFYVSNTKLIQFNFTNNNQQLHYNLSLYFTIRNPNERIGIYYDTIEATAVYKDHNFDMRLLTTFYQDPKAKNLLKTRFEGQQLVLLNGEELSKFHDEKVAGVYGIDIKLRLWMRLKFGIFNSVRAKSKVGCGFKVPLSFNDSLVLGLEMIQCHVDY